VLGEQHAHRAREIFGRVKLSGLRQNDESLPSGDKLNIFIWIRKESLPLNTNIFKVGSQAEAHVPFMQ